MRIALAMIVKGDAAEAKLLDRCLKNVTESGAIDGIFIMPTWKDSIDETEPVIKVANKYDATIETLRWEFDFAFARNANFAMVSKDYDFILWCDADDIWRGLENLKSTLKEHPHVDAFGMWYLYDWDEFKKPTVVHRKTMLVKNDGCVKWVGKLHEDLEETRQLDVFLIEGIDRLHLTTPERTDVAAKRNLDIASREAEEKPDDPRSYWNLGNSQFGVSDFEGARKTFEKFIEETHSDEEKYLAYQRIGDAYKSLERREDAVKNLQYAIGLKPMLPDAYLQLAYLFYSYQNLEKAEEYCLQGMVRRPQPNRLIVFNPRDYDYNPMMLLANIYFNKNRPDLMLPLLEGCLKIYPDDKHLKTLVEEGKMQKEALGNALRHIESLQRITDLGVLRLAIADLPEDVRSHPMVCALRNSKLVKTESSGRDLVIYCGQTTHQWEPIMFKTKGVGGSEEAVIHLASHFARLGWNVTVYNNCGHKPVRMKYGGGWEVTYLPYWEWNYRDKQDAVILWRWVKALDAEINSPKIFVDLHDVVPPGEFNEKRLAKVTKIFVKTKFHRSLFPNVPDEKIAVIPNGMETYADPKIKKDPMLVINTSSPDRSMDVLPMLWKRVKEQVPEAKLQWAYGWDIYKAAHASDPKKTAWMNTCIKEMKEAGIEVLGRLAQSEVGALYQRASFLAYPTEFAEIDCISVKKAQAALCAPVATDYGALKESIKYGIKVHSKKGKDDWNKPYQFHFGLEDAKAQDEWVFQMVEMLKGDTSVDWKGLDKWVESFSWAKIAERWNNVICE